MPDDDRLIADLAQAEVCLMGDALTWKLIALEAIAGLGRVDARLKAQRQQIDALKEENRRYVRAVMGA